MRSARKVAETCLSCKYAAQWFERAYPANLRIQNSAGDVLFYCTVNKEQVHETYSCKRFRRWSDG